MTQPAQNRGKTPTAAEMELRDLGEDCYECGGEGYIVADCFEDTCCCADPESEHGLIPCPLCGGKS
jgi:hypothetical protein